MTPATILLIYSIIVVIASFINLLRIDYWWVRIWDFPHLQLTMLTVAGLTGWLFIGLPAEWPLWLAPVGLLAAFGYQAWLIYPYTPIHQKAVKAAPKLADQGETRKNTFRLMVANVYMENTHTPDVLKLVNKHQPDLVLMLETNEVWREAMEPLEETYPYRLLEPLDNTYGLLFYSRLPLEDEEIRYLVQADIPSIRACIRLRSGQRFRFYGLHPMPPTPTEHYRSTERDAELLLVGKEARKMDEPTIVAGDLNDVAWSHSTRLFQRVSGLLDPRIGRGLFSTFHAKYFFLRWPLDHVFVSEHFQLQSMRRLPNCGSDHFPILVTFEYTERTAAVETPEPEGNDLEETHETINKAL
ncbi:endonuclease/exonuclease/phosphatase family protein [Spirosoma sp. KUDC1026]|uniref:endonuclease/exonuclease/phosphatase family protein n=1 Tax=Spirosoma sp. KUDC1026 TaxID=2745947 RepID=UPI00159BB1FF|nr:endonuclease/exonuclease/phosphatase family protein [Spirosoma sp. KUDC1026]QKZ14664.1 endonuclease/exonuclease/phosphatase family protein [Spirosoma sp. KUDC1026]